MAAGVVGVWRELARLESSSDVFVVSSLTALAMGPATKGKKTVSSASTVAGLPNHEMMLIAYRSRKSRLPGRERQMLDSVEKGGK